MENRAYTLGAGLFVLVLIVLLLGAILWFNDRGQLHGTVYDLITSSSVAGLAVGADVGLRGVHIGQVQSIQFDNDDPTTIRVRILVDPRFVLRQGTFAILNYQGLSGEAYVELDFPNQERGTLTSSVARPARIPLRLSSWAALPDTGERFLTSFTGTLGRVDSILSPENAQHLSRMLVEFTAAADQIATVAHDLQPVARRADGIGMEADAALRAAHKTLGDVDSLVGDVRARVGVLDMVGDGARETGLAARGVERALVRESLPRLNQVLEGVSQNSDTLQELLEQLKHQPQSVIFGSRLPPPGPGEHGDQSPQSSP
jgi:phospholipid/cholesterol/gamma-HCH transport system substrate-binding protein